MDKMPRTGNEAFAAAAGISPGYAAQYRRRLPGNGEGFDEMDARIRAEAATADLDAVQSIDDDDVEFAAEWPDPVGTLNDMVETRAERNLAAQYRAHMSWAHTDDRTERTRPAREAFMERFERQVDPDGLLAPDERRKRAEHLRKAHMLRMSLASAKARRERKQTGS